MKSPTDQGFKTNAFFSGGAGIFIEYHDAIKPVYLYAVIKMMMTGESYGLPIDIIKNFSILSIVEWYKNRRYRNPLEQLDWAHKIDPKELKKLMTEILKDETIYQLAPSLNIERLIYVYQQQHMIFPWYVYSDEYEPGIEKSCKTIFSGVNYKYLHGDMKTAIMKCDQNFTYIFSDIEHVAKSADILIGTCSHIILARDYRYNYKDNFKTMKYDLGDMAMTHPFLRIDTNIAMDVSLMQHSFDNVTVNGNYKEG